jgi:tetratricopeptide (TPR) repeat protein
VRILYATNRFPNGIAVVLCNGLTDPATVLQRVLARFDPQRREPQEADLQGLRDLAKQVFAERRALVVLDNVEPDLRVEQVIAPLRVAGAAVLLTSRMRLPVRAVPAEASRMLELLSPAEASDLFAEYVGRGTERNLTDTEQAEVARIVRALGYHTLAVKLAAARAQGRDLAAVAREYEAEPRLGVHLREGAEAVEVVLAASVHSLSTPAQQLFAALAAFATSDVGRQAAIGVGEQLEGPNAQFSLDALVDLRLVDLYVSEGLRSEANYRRQRLHQRYGSADPHRRNPPEPDYERLRLHPLLRAFAEEEFNKWDAPRRYAASHAVADYYKTYTFFHAEPEEKSVLEFDEHNITGALEWAHQDNQHELVEALCFGMRNFWRGYWRVNDSLTYLPWGISAAEIILGQLPEEQSGNALDRQSRLMLNYGQVLRRTGDLHRAERNIRQALEIRRRQGDRDEEGIPLGLLGQIAQQRGRLDEAVRCFEEALSVHRQAALASGSARLYREQGVVLNWLGQIAKQRGKLGDALSYFEQALNISRKDPSDPHRFVEGIALAGLGQIAQQRGTLDEAQNYFEQALATHRQTVDPREQADDLILLGQLALMRGLERQAEDAFKVARTLYASVRDPAGEGIAIASLGQVIVSRVETASDDGELQRAEQQFSEALRLHHETEALREEGVDTMCLARVAQLRANWDGARQHFHSALSTFRQAEDRQNECSVLYLLGRLAEAQDQAHEAALLYLQSLTISERSESVKDRADALLALGRLVAQQRDGSALAADERGTDGCAMIREAANLYAMMGLPAARTAREAAEDLGCS